MYGQKLPDFSFLDKRLKGLQLGTEDKPGPYNLAFDVEEFLN